MAEQSDRRLFPRISLHRVTVEVFSSDGFPKTYEFCQIKNLSESGMLFECAKRRYKTNALIGLTFVLPTNKIVIRANARVVHVRRATNEVHVGVEFKNLSDEERSMLHAYVEKNIHNGADA